MRSALPPRADIRVTAVVVLAVQSGLFLKATDHLVLRDAGGPKVSHIPSLPLYGAAALVGLTALSGAYVLRRRNRQVVVIKDLDA